MRQQTSIHWTYHSYRSDQALPATLTLGAPGVSDEDSADGFAEVEKEHRCSGDEIGRRVQQVTSALLLVQIESNQVVAWLTNWDPTASWSSVAS